MNRIKKERLNRGMSQQELAEVVGVSQAAEAGWEVGRCNPRPKHLLKLSKLFGITVDELLCELQEGAENAR